jgi:hypothetical protein
MRLRSEPFQLRGFVLVAFWLAVKLMAGLVIGVALFETLGVVVGLTHLVMGG